jgi:hypothetical protein
MTLSGVMCTYAIVNSGYSVGVGILIAIGVSLLVGVLNAFVVVVLKIDSFIGTLATGFLILALVQWRTGSRNITGPQLAGTFQDIAQKSWLFDLTLPVYYALVFAFVIWYLLEHTATGRRIYATGFNLDATRLAAVRTERLRFGCLMASGFLAGLTGIVLASNIGSGSPTAGASYLLPAFACRVRRCHPAEARALQRLGHDHRRRAARHADHRASVWPRSTSGCSSSPPVWCLSPPSPSPGTRCAEPAPTPAGPGPRAARSARRRPPRVRAWCRISPSPIAPEWRRQLARRAARSAAVAPAHRPGVEVRHAGRRAERSPLTLGARQPVSDGDRGGDVVAEAAVGTEDLDVLARGTNRVDARVPPHDAVRSRVDGRRRYRHGLPVLLGRDGSEERIVGRPDGVVQRRRRGCDRPGGSGTGWRG